MPDFPEFEINPQGPSEQQPQAPVNPQVNTQVADVLNRMATAADKSAESADRIAESLKRMPSVTEEISRKFKNINLELKAAVEFADDMEDAIKGIAQQQNSLRKGLIDTKKSHDAYNVLKAMITAQTALGKRLDKQSAAYKENLRQVKSLRGMYEDLRKSARDMNGQWKELSEKQLSGINGKLMEMSKNSDKMAKNLKSITLGKLNREMTAMSEVYSAFGVGKGYRAKIEKYNKFAEIPYKIKQAQRARAEGNRDTFRDKRDDALKAIKSQFGVSSVLADPKAQAQFLKTMGVSQKLSRGEVAYLAGEKGVKSTATTAAIEAAPISKTGKIFETASAGLEGAMGELAGFIAELGPVLAAVESAVLLLVEAFDGYVAQNKKIEGAIAGGGLFTTGEGAGGFGGARTALNPRLKYGVYSDLGITFDRNLKIAQSMVEGGQNISELVTGGKQMGMQNIMDRGEFGPGGFGQIQKAVVGAGRIAGLTDSQGVAQILKMLQQYRSTLEDSEDFFIRVGKAQQAAGISTVKYIGLIDEVMNRFSRMNKSLDQTVNLLGELSKTGRLGAEDLKDYMDFLTGGAGAQQKTGSPEQMFLYQQMGRGERDQQVRYRQQVYQGAVGEAGESFKKLGISDAELKKGLGGTNAEVQEFLTNRVVQAINNSTELDANQKQSANGLVQRLRKNRQDVDLWKDFSEGKISAVQMGMAGAVGGTNLQNSMALQQQAIKFILKQSGSMKQFLESPEKFAASAPQAVKIAEKLGISPEDMGKSLAETQRRGAEIRIGEAKESDTAAQELLKEMPDYVRQQQKASKLTASDFFKQHGNEFVETVAGLESTLGIWGKVAAEQQKKASTDEKTKALLEARHVAEQTQSSADIIANAFAKWFTEIISGIEFIVDHWPFTGSTEPLTPQDMQDFTTQINKNNDDMKKLDQDKFDAAQKGDDDKVKQIDDQMTQLKDMNTELSAMKSLGEAQSDKQKGILNNVRTAYGHEQTLSDMGMETAMTPYGPVANYQPPKQATQTPGVPLGTMPAGMGQLVASHATTQQPSTVTVWNVKTNRYEAVTVDHPVMPDSSGTSGEAGQGMAKPKKAVSQGTMTPVPSH